MPIPRTGSSLSRTTTAPDDACRVSRHQGGSACPSALGDASRWLIAQRKASGLKGFASSFSPASRTACLVSAVVSALRMMVGRLPQARDIYLLRETMAGDNRRLINIAMDDLGFETQAFAHRRMDQSIKKVLSGRKVDEINTGEEA